MPTKEEYKGYMKAISDAEKTPTTKEFPFDSISKKISFLEVFCKIIDNHPEELEESYRKVCKENNIKPSGSLVDYFLLDIAMFYDCAQKRFGIDNNSMPETYGKVMRFRNTIMAHFGDKIMTNADLTNEYDIVNGEDGKGFDRIMNDYTSFRDKIFERIKNEG